MPIALNKPKNKDIIGIKMSKPKRKHSTMLQSRLRRAKVLRCLLQGNNTKEVAQKLGLSRQIVYNDWYRISKNLKPKNFERLKRMENLSFPGKTNTKKCKQVIGIAKKVLRGQVSILPKKRSNQLPFFMRKKSKKLTQVLKDLRSTNKPFVQIQRDNGARYEQVKQVYNYLQKEEKIPERSSETSSWQQMDKKRITGQLSDAKIKETLQNQKSNIYKKAWGFYKYYRDLFNKAGFDAGDIADYIGKKLLWKLKTFDAKQVKKKVSFQQKIDLTCSVQITLLAKDMLRLARRKAEKETLSLDKSINSKWSGKTSLTHKDLLLKEITEQDPEKAISMIEKVSKKSGLSLREKTVVYTIFTRFTQEQTAKMLNISPSYVSLVLKSARQKMSKAGFGPK